MRAAAAAVTFLTRAPVGRVVNVSGDDVASSVPLFPLVGAAVGALTGATAIALYPRVSALLAAALAVTLSVVVTGAMHVDALGDTADAAGAASRERALEIMRDPRVGAFGATAIALDVVVKIAAIAQLLDAGHAFTTLVAAGVLSRAASHVLASTLPYPRPRGGAGSVLTGSVAPARVGVAVIVATAVAVAVVGSIAFAMAAVVLVSTGLLAAVYRWRFGGATGDALGAATEAAEVLALVLAAALV